MDIGKRVSLVDMFREPAEYKPPGTAVEIAASLDYPNLNSQQYRLTGKPTPVNRLYPCLDFVVQNSDELIIVAGNDFQGRRWCSSFYGWEAPERALDASKSCFKRQCRYSITALKFTKDPNLFLLGNDKGSVELWSTSNPARGDGFSLYQVDGQAEHTEGVSAMDVLEAEDSKLVTGSNDGCLKVWNWGAHLQSVSTMYGAHTDEIKGLSANRKEQSLFVSCSLDKSALLWDLRIPRSASALFENHKHAFSTIYWTSKDEANRLVALGDDAGFVHFVDTRQPNVFQHSEKVLRKRIHKISFKGTQFAVIGNTNEVKFYDDRFSLRHECTPAQNYIRDILWETNLPEESRSSNRSSCWLIGWNSFFQRVEF
ncbi:methylosome protein 50-like [Uranotaenia lowii]|uniref:methylosome protein 50-like n=1 Tax=Uranotaenia lowii TaxID=190385 RepID=UPI002479196B|nr:methylosome protein 50-like [Uranotaenia lowii]